LDGEHRQTNASPSIATPPIIDQVNSLIAQYFSRILLFRYCLLNLYKFCKYLILLLTENEKDNFESDWQIRCHPQYLEHNHRLSTNRQLRNAVPLLPIAEPCHLIALG
jgi:hypothetical protein